MSLGSFWCYVWWFALGALSGWLLWWLIDRLFLRDTQTPLRLAETEKEIEGYRNAHILHLSELEDAHAQARSAEELSAKGTQKIAELQKELDARKDLEKAYETEYNKALGEFERTTKLLEERSGEVSRLKTDLAAAAKREADSAKTQTESAEVNRQLQSTLQELNATTSRLTAANAEMDALKKRLSGQEAQSSGVVKLTADVDAARKSAASQNDEVARLKNEIERLKNEWSAATAHSASMTRLQPELEARTEQVRRLELEIDKLKSVLVDSKNALERQSAEISRLNGELATAPRHGDALTRLEAELATSRASESLLRSELSAASVRLANMDRMKEALEAARKAAAGHASEVARLNEQFFAAIGGDDPNGGKS